MIRYRELITHQADSQTRPWVFLIEYHAHPHSPLSISHSTRNVPLCLRPNEPDSHVSAIHNRDSRTQVLYVHRAFPTMWDIMRPILFDWLYPPRRGRESVRMGGRDRFEPTKVPQVVCSMDQRSTRGYVGMAKRAYGAGLVIVVGR